MTLGEKQRLFAGMVGRLITWCYNNDYELTFGEAYRTPEQAVLNAKSGSGISNSLHTKRLAIDLNLFVDTTEGGDEDVYQANSSAYLPLGEFWESIGGSWGGRFSRPDGNHFSLEHEGVR
jgi:hypothetical protein